MAEPEIVVEPVTEPILTEMVSEEVVAPVTEPDPIFETAVAEPEIVVEPVTEPVLAEMFSEEVATPVTEPDPIIEIAAVEPEIVVEPTTDPLIDDTALEPEVDPAQAASDAEAAAQQAASDAEAAAQQAASDAESAEQQAISDGDTTVAEESTVAGDPIPAAAQAFENANPNAAIFDESGSDLDDDLELEFVPEAEAVIVETAAAKTEIVVEPVVTVSEELAVSANDPEPVIETAAVEPEFVFEPAIEPDVDAAQAASDAEAAAQQAASDAEAAAQQAASDADSAEQQAISDGDTTAAVESTVAGNPIAAAAQAFENANPNAAIFDDSGSDLDDDLELEFALEMDASIVELIETPTDPFVIIESAETDSQTPIVAETGEDFLVGNVGDDLLISEEAAELAAKAEEEAAKQAEEAAELAAKAEEEAAKQAEEAAKQADEATQQAASDAESAAQQAMSDYGDYLTDGAETTLVISQSDDSSVFLFDVTQSTGNGNGNGNNGSVEIDGIVGGLGNDNLDGSDGLDILIGGSGQDVLNGSESSMGEANRDVIDDFNANSEGDVILLEGFAVGDLVFLGDENSAFSGGGLSAEARFNEDTKLLEIDADGDAEVDMEMTLENVAVDDLDASNFVVV